MPSRSTFTKKPVGCGFIHRCGVGRIRELGDTDAQCGAVLEDVQHRVACIHTVLFRTSQSQPLTLELVRCDVRTADVDDVLPGCAAAYCASHGTPARFACGHSFVRHPGVQRRNDLFLPAHVPPPTCQILFPWYQGVTAVATLYRANAELAVRRLRTRGPGSRPDVAEPGEKYPASGVPEDAAQLSTPLAAQSTDQPSSPSCSPFEPPHRVHRRHRGDRPDPASARACNRGGVYASSAPV